MNGKMTRLKALGILFVAVFSVMAVLPPTLALAEDTYANTSYTFPLESYGTWGTGRRQKNTDSACYLRINRIDMNSVNFYIDGWKSSRGTYVNRTRGDKAVASYTGHFQISNYVNENRDTHARLTAWAANGGGTVSGVWSPDTREVHTSLN